MTRRINNRSSLQRRIKAGKADPISDYEREQLEEMRQVFIRRFGFDPETGRKPRDEVTEEERAIARRIREHYEKMTSIPQRSNEGPGAWDGIWVGIVLVGLLGMFIWVWANYWR